MKNELRSTLPRMSERCEDPVSRIGGDKFATLSNIRLGRRSTRKSKKRRRKKRKSTGNLEMEVKDEATEILGEFREKKEAWKKRKSLKKNVKPSPTRPNLKALLATINEAVCYCDKEYDERCEVEQKRQRSLQMQDVAEKGLSLLQLSNLAKDAEACARKAAERRSMFSQMVLSDVVEDGIAKQYEQCATRMSQAQAEIEEKERMLLHPSFIQPDFDFYGESKSYQR